MTNERKCKLVKITATSKLGEPLTDKRTYLLDENTMTVYAPWAHVEMLYALNLQIEELSEGEPSADRWILCSERMPEATGFYLIQYSRAVCADEMAVAYYSVEEKESDPDYDWEFKPICGEYKKVIAWRELPKLWEGEKE